MAGQAKCWNYLGWMLLSDRQLGSAEEAGFHAIDLSRDQGREYWICGSHRLLGEIYQYKGEGGKAVQHFEAAIGIASPFDWHNELFWANLALAVQFCNENKFDNAQSHLERAKAHAIDDVCNLGRAMRWQAEIWYRQGRLEEGKAEILCALETFEKLGATAELPRSRSVLKDIERAMERR